MDALESCLSVTNNAPDVLNEGNQHAHLLLRVVIDPVLSCVYVCVFSYELIKKLKNIGPMYTAKTENEHQNTCPECLTLLKFLNTFLS